MTIHEEIDKLIKEKEVKEMEHRATYSPEDNKLRIYPSYRLPKNEYLELKNAGFSWAPKQELFVAPMWTPTREDIALKFCGEIEDEDTSLVDRAEIRADRFEDYSEKRLDEANQAKEGVKAITDGIPFGQPILVGHHSERRARKDATRIENGMRKAVKLWETSKYWEDRAAGALRHAKYKERPDVRARRIKKIEAEIRKYKASYTPKYPNQIINQERWYCPICQKFSCKDHPEAKEKVPHVYCGASRGGSWVAVEDLPKIEKSYKRWIAHCENRLVYEKAMLGEQGKLDLIAPKPRPKQLPLLNYRAPEGITVTNPQYYAEKTTHYQQFEMTRAEYSQIYEGARMIRPVNGTHRVRICTGYKVPAYMALMPGGLDQTDKYNYQHKSVTVFLTDSKEHPRPEPVEKAEKKEHQIKLFERTMPVYQPPKRTEFDDIKDSLREGIKTVSAPQLFVTPPAIAERMIQEANIQTGERVLEPSAGSGQILGTILHGEIKNIKAVAIDINSNCISMLKAQHDAGAYPGAEIKQADFLDCNGELGKFDHIIMNPPFENGIDIKHIKHAMTFLAPGGRLVALCANGPRQNNQLKPIAEDSGGFWEPLPQGSFKQSGTNVNVALLVIEN